MTEVQARLYTSKQMGDACEMLVAAELTLAGVPALKVPENWPGYDVIAQREGTREPLRISAKSRTYKKGAAFVSFYESDPFDWLAIVLLNCDANQTRRIYLIPADVAQRDARRNSPTSKNANARYWRIDEIESRFTNFESNFQLRKLRRLKKPRGSRGDLAKEPLTPTLSPRPGRGSAPNL